MCDSIPWLIVSSWSTTIAFKVPLTGGAPARSAAAGVPLPFIIKQTPQPSDDWKSSLEAATLSIPGVLATDGGKSNNEHAFFAPFTYLAWLFDS